MPTLLVIDRDDCLWPRGWVTSVLPDGVVPSDYERGGGLWKPVPVSPEAAPKIAGSGFDFRRRAMLLGDGELAAVDSAREFLAARLESTSRLRSIPGPASLDRSRSTVWDYGPGRTYSTPQAAFDALVAQVGADPFDETHYVRGWSGTHGQDVSGATLWLATVAPSSRYPLVIDVAEGEAVTFDDEQGSFGLAGTDVSHVRVESIRIIRAAFAVAPADLASGVVIGWRVERIEVDGAAGSMICGVSVYNADHLAVVDSELRQLWSCGVGTMSGVAESSPGLVTVSGCKVSDSQTGIFNNSPVTYILVNNVFHASAAGIEHEGTAPLILAGALNNIFAADAPGFDCIRTTDLGPEGLIVTRSDGACFQPGANGAVADLAGTILDLGGWREWFGQDQLSILADPDLDLQLTPRRGSPCLGAGVAWSAAGCSGGGRAASIDIGAEQVTRPFVPSIAIRRAPEIVRRYP